MDFLTAIATCSLHNDIGLVVALALGFSGGNPYHVEDLRGREAQLQLLDGPKSPNRQSALAEFQRITKNGGAPIGGLLPVPTAWTNIFQRTPADIFSPCINISIATAMLSEFEYECGSKGDRSCVLRKYDVATGVHLESAVLARIKVERQPKVSPEIDTNAINSAPVFNATEDNTRQWGADRVFFGAAADVRVAASHDDAVTVR